MLRDAVMYTVFFQFVQVWTVACNDELCFWQGPNQRRDIAQYLHNILFFTDAGNNDKRKAVVFQSVFPQ